MQVVPELDVLLLLFPAKKNFLPAEDRREINQAAVEVLDLDSAPVKFAQGFCDLRGCFGPLVDRFPTQVQAAGKQTGQSLVVSREPQARLGNLLQPLPDLREQGPRFVAGVMLLEDMAHVILPARFRRVWRRASF